jgi:hypothetical protein
MAAAFSTLVLLLPWELLKAIGWSDDDAGLAAFSLLFPLGLAALALRRHPWAQHEFEFVRETFRVSAYLRDLALFAWAELVLVIGIWVFLNHS